MPRPANDATGGVPSGHGAVQALDGEQAMADESPRRSMSKQSGKSIKEKRVERRAKADPTPQMERLTRDQKHTELAPLPRTASSASPTGDHTVLPRRSTVVRSRAGGTDTTAVAPPTSEEPPP
jgi:hypothetical protein